MHVLNSSQYEELWSYVRAFVSVRVPQKEDAEDTTQEVFQHLLRKGALRKFELVAENFTHLRYLLLRVARRLIIDRNRRVQALKRGGQSIALSIERDLGDVLGIPDKEASPSSKLEFKEVRITVEEQVNKLRQHYVSRGQAERFAVIEPHLNPLAESPLGYEDAARRLSMTRGAVRLLVCRARRELAGLVAERLEIPRPRTTLSRLSFMRPVRANSLL